MTVGVLCASLLAAALTASTPSLASGTDHHTLTHQKSELGRRLAGSNADLGEISRRLVSAQAGLDAALSDLSSARSRLAALQVAVHLAAVRDQKMQQALDEAMQRLADAQGDLARGRSTVSQQRRALASFAVSSMQSEVTQLSTLGLVFGARSTHQAIARVQGADSALNVQLGALERLQANQVLLRYTEQRVQQAAARVAADRAAAASHLSDTRALEADAASAETAVEGQVAELQSRRDQLSSAKAAELARIATMQRERASLEARLRRIAERRAAASRAAASTGASSALSADAGFLSYPVRNTYVTSPYGMRMHPILHIWELHDGTDFHAVCGTPVYAAADGRVTSEYYNTGYGNRLVIDHGLVHGVSLWTSYNHLSSYVAGVGAQVTRGQLVAYSGTTGYSTGCHLHFMVYVNGYTVNPMTWL